MGLGLYLNKQNVVQYHSYVVKNILPKNNKTTVGPTQITFGSPFDLMYLLHTLYDII